MSLDPLNQTLILKDGRRLGFAEYGEPKGQAVFHFHGSASSRLEHPASEDQLVKMRIHFIAVDRPGHGLSEFQPDRHITDWPKDVCQLADHLDIPQFYVEGYSSGGPYALVCANRLQGRVRVGAVISSAAPMTRPGAYKGLPLSNQVLARSARWFPFLTKFIRRMMQNMVMKDAGKSAQELMGSIPETDKAILYAPENLDIFTASVREGFRSGYRGIAQDDVLINRDWEFDLESIQPRIDIWQGDADVNVPVQAARYLQAAIPHSRLTILPGQGHFFLFDRWPEILKELVSPDTNSRSP